MGKIAYGIGARNSVRCNFAHAFFKVPPTAWANARSIVSALTVSQARLPTLRILALRYALRQHATAVWRQIEPDRRARLQALGGGSDNA